MSLVIERASKAKARGATPLAVLSGYGCTADATLSVNELSDSTWLTKAMETSLTKSQLKAADIDLVYGHGRGLPKQDQLEVAAIRQVFGDKKPAVSSVIGKHRRGCGHQRFVLRRRRRTWNPTW